MSNRACSPSALRSPATTPPRTTNYAHLGATAPPCTDEAFRERIVVRSLVAPCLDELQPSAARANSRPPNPRLADTPAERPARSGRLQLVQTRATRDTDKHDSRNPPRVQGGSPVESRSDGTAELCAGRTSAARADLPVTQPIRPTCETTASPRDVGNRLEPLLPSPHLPDARKLITR